MPRIPAETTQTAFSQGSLPYQDIAANPADFGALGAQAMQRAGQTLEQSGQQTFQTAMLRQQFVNENQSTQALNSFQQHADDLLNGNPENGTVGFTTLRGENAVQEQQSYQSQLQQSFNDVRAGLNPAAQRQFDMMGHWALRAAMSRLGAHAAQQDATYQLDQSRSSVALAQQGTLAAADDPAAWAKGLAAIQDASQRSAQMLGLDGPAADQLRQQDLGAVFVQRVKQLALRNPIEAKSFLQSNIGAIPANQRFSLQRMVGSMTSTQYAATDGIAAYHAAIGAPQGAGSGGMPQNFNAPIVKPYDQQQVDAVAAQVTRASPYDAEINATAAKYNLNPFELKLHLAAESGFNANAVSPQGAVGIAQLMPDTAKALGVDPKDPAQAIDGMARLMVQAEAKAGDDPGAIDRYYYGGNVSAAGPNTDQYVANLAAVRAKLHGGQVASAPMTSAQLEGMEGDVLRQADALAAQRRPGDDAYRLQVEAEAQKNWARQVQVMRGQEYANASTVMDAVVKGGYQSAGELPASLQQVYGQLTPQNLDAVRAQFSYNQRAAAGAYTPSDPALVNGLRARLFLPAGDPNRINDPGQILGYLSKGLNYADSQHLITELKDVNDPSLSPFLHQVNQVKLTAQKMLQTSLSATALQHPELAQEASYRFNFALDQQIATMKNAGKNPAVLFDPTSPDYVLAPTRVLSFMSSEPQGAAAVARGVQVGQSGSSAPPRLPGETPAAYLARIGFQGNR